MKKLLILSVLLFTVVFTYTTIAQEMGAIRKNVEYSFPEKIQKLVLDPLPAGTYSIGTGGYFPTIDSAFNKLSIDGIAGEVILELIDNLYTAPSVQYGFVLNGPIPGAGPNSRVTIKPADNKNVTIEGNNEALLFLINTSYVTIDGIDLTGSTTLTVHTLQTQFPFNDTIDFLNNSDHNIVQNVTFISEDSGFGPAFFVWEDLLFAPDSNLIQNNFIKKGGLAIYVVNEFSAVEAIGNIIRGNIVGSETDSLISWGIQATNTRNTIIENNIVHNIRRSFVWQVNAPGIDSYSCSGIIIRNNIVHSVRSDAGFNSIGIILAASSNDRGSNNQVYNNMIYDIQSTSTQSNSHVAGIEIWNQDNPKIYYNSVYLSGTGNGANPSGSAAFYIFGGAGGSSGVDLKNNIFVNTRDESPYWASSIYDYNASNLTSDYNDLYYELNQYNALVRIGSTNYNTLADWQATGKDLNSISEMPNFVDPYLHIDETIPTNLERGATPIAGIDKDFDGDTRNAITPDIGADEFDGLTFEDPLPAGTYTIGMGGNFATIQDAFNKLENDGIAGEVILELTDSLYTVPSVQFGFVLNGPIPGAGPNSRVTVKPAANKNVTIEGNSEVLLYLINTSYVTLDGIGVTGATTLTIHTLENLSYDFNDAINFINNSDHNIIQNITFIVAYTRNSGAGFWFTPAGSFGPDSNLIQNNFVKQAGLGLFIANSSSAVKGIGNIIRGNLIGSETDSLISVGIQLEYTINTIVENNIVQNLRYYGNPITNLNNGISALGDEECIIRNNIVHNIYAKNNPNGGSAGILLAGTGGSNNLVYNNMVYDIQSTSPQTNSRVAGIQIWNQTNPKIYYNSVYLTGTGANSLGSAALYIYGGSSGVDLKDNIFVNTRDESPYWASSIYDYSASNLTTDYNDLFYQPNQNNCLVKIGGTKYNTLADWQATGQDLNSVNEMPNFKSPFLHIDETIPTNLERGATPIAGIDKDFDGDTRNAITPDIGADEFITIGDTLYVPTEYATIQAAINAAIDGNLILVDEGTYYENINFSGKAITVASHFILDENETHIENTIINGSTPSNPDSGSVVYFTSGEDTTSVLCGFTITGGAGTYTAQFSDVSGGGIYLWPSGAKILNNIIEYNSANSTYVFGGGILADVDSYSSLVIENNIIRNNTTNGDTLTAGGGICLLTSGYVRIKNNIIVDNTVNGSEATGGGIFCDEVPANEIYILNNYIKGNECNSNIYGGGGLSLSNCTAVVKNNLIVGNSALNGGGVFLLDVTSTSSKSKRNNNRTLSKQINRLNATQDNSSAIALASSFENNTIVNNSATGSGGGITIVGSSPQFLNFIIWGNTAPSDPQISGTTDVQYSDVEGGWAGTGNMEEDPIFDDSTYFVLNYHSPCIDEGNPDPMYYDVEDPQNLGYAFLPARGSLINDMGHCGGPSSLWSTWDIPVSVENDGNVNGTPDAFTLLQNYPNPFNPSTTIIYSIPEVSKVRLTLFNLLGEEVATLVNEENSAGNYIVEFNAANLPSGIYFYQLRATPNDGQAGSFVETKKMILLK